MRSLIGSAARGCFRQFVTRRCRATSTTARWMSSSTQTWTTPLAKQLSEAISATGPVPLATFMRMCLTSDQGGYYTAAQEGRDQFGRKGDFITSPEISQVFGELIGVWFVAEWMSQGKRPNGIQLIEIGPGRGTLMDDILRTIKNFKPMASAIEAIYLVEASPALRDAQKKLLCGDAPMLETDIGYKSTSKHTGVPVLWTENIRFVPHGITQSPFIVAHEFFDALPIHAFQSVTTAQMEPATIATPTGEHTLSPQASRKAAADFAWRELMVSPAPPGSTHTTLGTPKTLQSGSIPEFQLTVSKAATPHSMYLPEVSPRYKALRSQVNSVIEISPDSRAYVEEFARRIGGSDSEPKPFPSGAALILDYGPADTIPTNSLRGIRNHQKVSPLSSPGLVDLSADVDFIALAEAALEASSGIEVHGPVEQATFLLSMGIKERAEMLMKGPNLDSSRRTRIDGAWRRLVDKGGNGMGKIYKAMAIIPETAGKRRPVGFGGDVAGS